MQKTNLTTSDGLNLAALAWEGKGPASIILLHAMPADKESWTALAEQLNKTGHNVLAFDFRGHGESDGGNWEDFSDEQHQQYSLDLDAAVEYIKENFPGTEIYLGGASIGANIAIQYLAAHPEIKKAAALSAGLDYHGVNAEELVKELDPSQDLLLIAAADDMRKSGTSSSRQAEILYDLANCKKEKMLFQTGGHGTALLAAHPELLETIQDFFDN
jgi:pimeloyl-ACP methyl ester carboxylesterase